MAKKEDEPITRVLREILPSGHITITDGNLTAGSFPGYIVDDSSVAFTNVYMLNQYFDLQGYSIRDLTTYIQAAIFQKIGAYGLGVMQAGVTLKEYLVVSTVPLDYATDFNMAPIPDTVPGSLTSQTSLQDIVQATCIVYSQNAGAEYGGPIEVNTWGVGDSTASDRLYYSRFFSFSKLKGSGANATYGFQFPEVGVVVPIIVAKEEDLEYIMRLARSVRTYEPV